MQRFVFVSFALLVGIAQQASAQKVRVFVTSQAGDRLSEKPAIQFQPQKAGKGFVIDESDRKQEMVGFGASFLESGMMCLRTLGAEQQEKLLQSLFDGEKGAGFSAMKTDIGGSDFMAAGPFYSYDNHQGDTGLKFFSIQRDLGANGQITFIKRARRYGQFVLEATMDYPPDWMLVDVHKQQDIKPEDYQALADYYVRYAQAYQQQGVFVDYVSLFNEPSIYTKTSPESIRTLLALYVGPAFAKAHLKNGIVACENDNRQKASRYWKAIMSDPEARQYVSAIMYHGYQYKDYDKIAELHRSYPNLKIWMTEVCHAYETGDPPRSHEMPYMDYADGDFWGNQIFSDLESGTSAWIYWNMILDETGGPWSVSVVHENPDRNNQHPVVIVDKDTHQVTYTGLYYYLAHFSKFVRPGAVRIGTKGEEANVRCMAFQTKGGGFTVEVMNRGEQSVRTSLNWKGRTIDINLPALSISTYLWNW